ncbi:CotY/CotZ family spore coat protein [Bacillus sp. REN3]|uniref:CotY/CotZ family spore coat protein n=1 Tax=Bacillus sp. REN3 TaxID=2802440 RepID=UPI001AEDABE5|nr:CotY/CotZ family spore coat protein [Bacillus sp. REN3]
MSCGKHNGGGSSSDNCVCDVLREIARVQDMVEDECCVTSCERSIQALLGETANNNLDTIPIILYCKCDPFLGVGVGTATTGGNTTFDCIESFVFRVCSVDDDCCAVLELLDTGHDPNPSQGPCSQFQGNVKLTDLTRTGVCITVDLSCFCAVTCLPAVTAHQ